MNWELAIEKNREALRRTLAMLLSMVGMTAGDASSPSAKLPRHLHRFVLSLLRPAESATRRLIIVAARGLAMKLPKPRAGKSEQSPPRTDPRAMPEWARLRLEHGLPIEFPRGEPIPLWARETASRETLVPAPAPRVPFFPMFDPMKRFDRGPARRRFPEGRMPRIALLNDDGWSVPIHLRRAPPPPPPPAPDDPLDAANIHRRLDMIGRALDDLPRQAQRFARWKARRDARLARERENRAVPFSVAPPSVLSLVEGPDISPTRGEISLSPRVQPLISPLVGEMSGPSTRLRTEGGAKERGGREETLAELGLTPEAIALLNRSKRPGHPAQPSIVARAKPRRFTRIELLRPGRPPGWRRKPTHEIHEVLNDLHGLAVWAQERLDTS